MNEPLSKPRRRLLRISLRTFLALLTVGCVWLGWKVNKAQKQRAAVAWVEEMGGSVEYDRRFDDDPWADPFGYNDPKYPTWLRDLLGIDIIANVVHVDLGDNAAVDDISPLANLSELEYVELENTSVSNLRPLANLVRLEFVYLSNTKVSDLSPLKNQPKLFHLLLENSPVNDLSPLVNSEHLNYLDLNSTHVSDVTPLAKLHSLAYVGLLDAPVSQEDAMTLREALPNCTVSYAWRVDE